MKGYISAKEACRLLGTTRQNIFYLQKHSIIKNVIKVHPTCFLYNKEELIGLKSLGYGK